MDELKPVFRDLSSVGLLKRCLHGKTQNPNESLNSVIWTRIPKTVFVIRDTLKFGVYGAVLCFNAGVAKMNDVLTILGARSGSDALKQIDMEVIRKAKIATLSITREARKNKRAQKEDQEVSDDPEYGAGKH
jgi:hypothetical protein